MLKELKAFLLRGNILDLAVAVVVGGAFGLIVASLVNDIITPLIAAIVGQPDFTKIVLQLNGTDILVGNFIQAIVNFAIVGTVLFFIVKAAEKTIAKPKEVAPAGPTSEELLVEIRDLLKSK